MTSETQNVVFNPLDKQHLGESVRDALLRQPVLPIANLEPFHGAGIFAIYYTGDFDGYDLVSIRNINGKFGTPLYVGGAFSKSEIEEELIENEPGMAIYNQLLRHVKSLEEASNLAVSDFYYRYLIVDDIWIQLGISALIAWHDPLWNKLIDGFDNGGLNSICTPVLCPRWDLLHPGRSHATGWLLREESAVQIKREIYDYLRGSFPPRCVKK